MVMNAVVQNIRRKTSNDLAIDKALAALLNQRVLPPLVLQLLDTQDSLSSEIAYDSIL
jgi:hypothetical protein